MANTYTQIYLQLVFCPLGRENIIPKRHKEELHKYTTGIIQNRKHKLFAVNFMPDHVHVFIGYDPGQPIPGPDEQGCVHQHDFSRPPGSLQFALAESGPGKLTNG